VKRQIVSKISLWVQALFYTGSGINHLLNPGFYLELIPSYLPFHQAINIVSGIIEIVLGVGLIALPKYRKQVAFCIIIFLLVILPAHIYHLSEEGCLPSGFCIPVWACWFRIFLQFAFMYWAWSIRKLR
jgi:uncharacterized membrane protein